MKQRTAVRALVRKQDQTLLMRRANGRKSILGKYELPGGKIEYHEQPEDALRRYLEKDAGLKPSSVQLFDVITYIDSDDSDLQYVFIVYLVNVEHDKVMLSGNYDKAIWQSKSKIQHREVTESSQVLLGLSRQMIGVRGKEEKVTKIDDIKTTNSEIIIYSDGGSRGNPGLSAAAYVIEDSDSNIIEKAGQFLGVTTSYQAEYKGLLLGLERALELGYRNIEYRLDSLMVVNQMKGIYTVKNRELWPINERIIDLLSQFEGVKFVHVRREFNTVADGEVNRILDMHAEHASSSENTV